MRVTVVFKDDLYQQLQQLRGKRIQAEKRSLSTHALILELVESGLKAIQKNNR